VEADQWSVTASVTVRRDARQVLSSDEHRTSEVNAVDFTHVERRLPHWFERKGGHR
jgi:hypothetical protein